METQKWTVGGELRIGFFSLRAIKAGEECTIDYQYRQHYGEKRRKCYCGSELCCGVLGGSAATTSGGPAAAAPRDEDDEDDELADDDSDVAAGDSDEDSEADVEKAPVFVATGRIKALNVRRRASASTSASTSARKEGLANSTSCVYPSFVLPLFALLMTELFGFFLLLLLLLLPLPCVVAGLDDQLLGHAWQWPGSPTQRW